MDVQTASPKQSLVSWDTDRQNPLNWGRLDKWSVIVMVGIMTVLSPLGSTFLAPMATAIAAEFEIENNALVSLIVSIYILGYAVGPFIACPLSEVYGRNISLQAFMILFCIFNTACAVSHSATEILVFRFLAGCAGSAPMSIGVGTITDCFRKEERGYAMAIFTSGVLLGPIIGPIAAAWLMAGVNWRWAIWVVVIISGLLSFLSFFLLKETYHPIIKARKARMIDQQAEQANGSVHNTAEANHPPAINLKDGLSRPFILLFTNPICAIIGVYLAICVGGYLYVIFVTFGDVFVKVYGQSVSISTLHFIAPGAGSFVGNAIFAWSNDRIYHELKQRAETGEGQPEFRIPLMFFASFLVPIGLTIYGWTAQYQLHWILPDIGIFIFSIGVIITFLALNTYVADAFTYSASAIAATTVLKNLAGAIFPLFAKDITKNMGLGWSNTLLALIALVMGGIYPAILWHYGPRLRASAKARETSH